jgi:hypothetical protein
MILERMKIDADLSEASLGWAKEQVLGEPQKLTVSTALMDVATRIIRNTTIKLYVDTELEADGWYLQGQWNGVFSPGA